MPLQRLDRAPYIHRRTRAICFSMCVESRPVLCMVTPDAITRLTGKPQPQNAQRLQAFAKFRTELETIARNKFEADAAEPILITEADIPA